MRQFIVIAVLLCAISNFTFPSDNAGAFLDTGLGARSAALGLSGVALGQASEAVYWNPAALSKVTAPVGQISAFNGFETRYISISGAAMVMNWPVGIGYVYAGVDSIPESLSTVNHFDRGEWALTGNTFGSYQHGLLVSTGVDLLTDLAMGVTAKGIYQTLYNNHAVGMGMDIAFLYKPFLNYHFGLTIQNVIKPGLEWDTESRHLDVMPTRYKLGLLERNLNGKLIESTDCVLQKNRPAQWHYGLELTAFEPVALRLGYQTDSAKLANNAATLFNGLSAGCGISLKPITLDIAWVNGEIDEIGDVYRVSIGFSPE